MCTESSWVMVSRATDGPSHNDDHEPECETSQFLPRSGLSDATIYVDSESRRKVGPDPMVFLELSGKDSERTHGEIPMLVPR
jgi:hypothetical protein